MYALKIISVVAVCYLIGNVNNALIISRIKKRDIRAEGSGNPGAMNMIRNFGAVIGITTLILDAIKGAIGCIIGWFVLGEAFTFGADKLGMYVGGLSVIVGHIFPVFLKFKGGKGIASSIGICFVLNPLVAAITTLAGLIFIIVTKMGAVTSFIIIAYPLAFAGYKQIGAGNLAEALIVLAMFCLTLFCHRKNIYKLFTGVENKTNLIKKKKNKSVKRA